MTKPLVVVESPTKVRTIKKYLGKEFNIAATVGHLKDLPPKEIGVDIENGFAPQYINIPGKQRQIKALRQAAKDATVVYLAPDPDREGEAIAFHTAEILKKKGRQFHRVLFNELTKSAILESMSKPQDLNHQRYEAQKTRRVLDRLVGYQISPLLWRKVKGGLSAGRVQSVAVRIICEREREIQRFDPQEYWSITTNLESADPPAFNAKLVKYKGKKLTIPDQKSAQSMVDYLQTADFIIDKVVKKTTRRNPAPPFTTSKMQQEAIRKLRFTAKKTMMVAQQLYEGIDLGPGEPEGLITYMRTDSQRISDEAAQEAMALINENFGPAYALDEPRFFKNPKKVQDAHEAIRPTSAANTPEKLAAHLSKDQLALYTLIWKRFIASQMKQALIDQVSISVAAGDYTLTASGSTIKFPGFMTLYLSADQEMEQDRAGQKSRLPELAQGAVLKLNKIDPKQHFTQPPPRFSEASLVKELEENGIGRPSTYAAILSTIRDKGYVELLKAYFRPSELGFIVNDLLVASFPELFSVDFTAGMEDSLDRIETEKLDATQVMSHFYEGFSTKLDTAKTEMLSMRGVGQPTDITCPTCEKAKLNLKFGRNGHYLACSDYPECTFSCNYTRDEKGQLELVAVAPPEETDQVCTQCGKPMLIKQGKYGPFMACSGYPECKLTLSLNTSANGQETGVACPRPNCEGQMVERKSKRGKVFYGCSQYPACDHALWDKPVPEPCPECQAPFLVAKSSKKKGHYLACADKACPYERPLTDDEAAPPSPPS